jgi:2-C-methyl-D-erythritol 4-phosphate cytidylyltransferase
VPEAVRFTAIVLAAQRAGRLDPLAEKAGVTHKCLVPIVGRPLIEWVLETLVTVPGVERIRICVEEEAMDEVRAVAAPFEGRGKPIDFAPAKETITESVYEAALGIEGAILVTTADNVNMTRDAVEQVMAPLGQGYEGALALATRASVLAARSDEKLGYTNVDRVGPYRFKDDRYSNCNMYGIAGERVLRMAEAFRAGGQFSKNKKRLVGFLGLFNIVLLRFKLLTLEQAMERLSKRFGVRVKAVVLEDGAQAVDVDNERTYRLAEQILLQRRANIAGSSSPATAGEGDHPQGGGGVTGSVNAVSRQTLLRFGSYPSTMLRMVPLPICDGEELSGLRVA